MQKWARVLCAAGWSLSVLSTIGCADPEIDKQRYLTSGDRYLAEAKYQQAIVEYRNAVQIDQRFGPARLKLAEAYAAAGEAQNAHREYMRAADLLPDDLDAQMKAATLLTLAGRFEDARTRVDAVLARNPSHVEAHVLRGSILAGLKDLDGAVGQIEEAIQIDPTHGGSYTSLGALELEPQHALANRAMAALYLSSDRASQAEPYLKTLAEVSPGEQGAFVLADYYVAMRRVDEATAVLTPLTNEPRTAADASVRLAQLEYAADRAAAHARLDGVLSRQSQHVRALLTKAGWLLAEGRRPEALARAEAAVKASPENPATHYLAGVIHAQMQNLDGATAAFNEVLRLNPRVAAAQLQLARVQLARGAAAEAVQLAETALTNAPGNPEVRLTLASGLIAQRDYARAESLAAALGREFPNAAAVHALNGVLHLSRRNIAAARAAYERSLELDRTYYPALAGMTAVDMIEGRNDAARARVERRLAETPDDVLMLMLASRVYVGAGQPEHAERALRRVIQLTPADSRAYGMLGQLYIAQQRLEEARAEFDAVASRNPKDVSSRTVAAMLSHTTNDLADAKKRYREILDRAPNAAVAANNLAWIMAEEGRDLDEALRLAQRAAAEAPDRAEIHDTVGWIYYRQELPLLAIPAFERSIKQSPQTALYHFHLALAHQKSGNLEEARGAVAAALKLDPQHREALELQKRLGPPR